MMKGWFYVNSACQLCLKPGTPELSALLWSGALDWLNSTSASRRVVHSWLVGMRVFGVGSVGQVSPMNLTKCLLCPHGWGEAMLCTWYNRDKEHSFGTVGTVTLWWSTKGDHRAVPSGKVQDGLKVLSSILTLAVIADKPAVPLVCWAWSPVLCRAGWQPQWPAAAPGGTAFARGHFAISDLIPVLPSTGRSLWKGCKALGMENTTYSAWSLLSPWQRYGPYYTRISSQPKWLRLKLLQKVP